MVFSTVLQLSGRFCHHLCGRFLFDLQVLILGGGIYPQGPIGLDKPGDLLVVM